MKARRRLLLGLLLTLLLSAGLQRADLRAQAAAPEIAVTVDRTRVTVGDPINLTVTVRHTPDVHIVTNSLDDQLGLLEPLASELPDERSVGSNLELRMRYKVAIYHTGPLQVPGFVISYTQTDGTQAQVTAQTTPEITVQSILPADANPTDIKGLKQQFSLPSPPAANGKLVAGIAAVVIAVLLGSALAAVLLRRRAGEATPLRPEPAIGARAELDRIMALELPARGELIEHYRLLALCVRRFLSERYGFPAMALTTSELEQRMEAAGVDRWPARLVCGLLNECDAVVYARYVPAATRGEADNAMAYEILETMDGSAPRIAVPVR